MPGASCGCLLRPLSRVIDLPAEKAIYKHVKAVGELRRVMLQATLQGSCKMGLGLEKLCERQTDHANPQAFFGRRSKDSVISGYHTLVCASNALSFEYILPQWAFFGGYSSFCPCRHLIGDQIWRCGLRRSMCRG